MRAVASVAPYITTKSNPRSLPEPRESPHPLGVESATRLRDVPQRRQVALSEARRVEHLERVGHSGERRRSGLGELAPEVVLDDRPLGEARSTAPAARWLFTTESP